MGTLFLFDTLKMVTEPKSGGKSEVNDSNNDNKKRLLTPGFINDIDNGSILWTGGLKQELGGSIKEKAGEGRRRGH